MRIPDPILRPMPLRHLATRSGLIGLAAGCALCGGVSAILHRVGWDPFAAPVGFLLFVVLFPLAYLLPESLRDPGADADDP